MNIYRRGNIKLFFGNDPALRGYWRLNGNALDESNNGNHGTGGGGVLPYFGKFGGAYRFDGVDDIITIPNSSSLQNLTVLTMTAWFRILSITGGSDWNTIVMKGNYTNNGYGFLFQDTAIGGSGNLNMYIPGIGSLSISPRFSLNRWYCIVGTADSNARRIYIDGVLRASGAGGTVSPTTANFAIGKSVSDYPSNIIVCEAAIFSRALSINEVAGYYNWAIAQDKKYPTYFFAPSIAPPPSEFDALLLAGD